MKLDSKKQIAAIFAATLLCGLTAHATVEVFTTAGTSQWQCPAGVTTVTVECWGGGGAGGSVTNAGSGPGNNSTVGGGGAGGTYVIKTNISVTPGNFYTVTVGAGGTSPALPPTDGDHGDGGDSWFNDTSTVLAKGGAGGISKNAIRPAQGNGGSCPAGSIGDIINLGGSGGNANGTNGFQAAGGGGGSGGTLTAGNNGSLTNGALAVAGGGAGGNGKAGGTSGAGSPGTSPGGGGGGGNAAAGNQKQLGGAGADGKVAISYTIAGTSYTWVATSDSADWTSPSSWSPSRTSPANNDVLVFNQGGNSTAVNVPAETDGKLQVLGNTIINLQASGANTLTIGETAADSLTVASGSQLIVNGASALNINLPTGARGSISGLMTFSNAADTLTAFDASGITFNSGATFTQNCSGNVFGSGTANSVIFASGSTFIQLTGGNPFQKGQPASVVVFQHGSLFSCQGNTSPSASGRTYANFECNATNTVSLSGSSPLNMDDLNVIQNMLNIGMSGGFNLNGNATVASGAILNLNNNVATASGKTITINGTLGGTATITGNAAFTISSTGTLAPGTSAATGTLTLATEPTLNGTNFMKIDRNGGSPLADKIALSSGTLALGGTLVVTNIGADLQVNDSFTLFSAPTFAASTFNSLQLPDGYTWDTSQLTNDGSIRVSAVGGAPTPEPIILQPQAGQLVMSWNQAAFSLAASTNVAGPYEIIPGATSPYTNSTATGTMFFRLEYSP